MCALGCVRGIAAVCFQLRLLQAEVGEERLDVSRAGVYDAVLAEGRVVPLIVQEVRRAHLRSSATAKGGGQLPQGFSAAFISAALLSLL